MTKISRRFFLMVASILPFSKTFSLEKAVPLDGYSSGKALSKIDGLKLLNLWGDQPKETQSLYTIIDSILSQHKLSSYADVARNESFQTFCRKHDITHLGGPMLGCITETSAKIWIRTTKPMEVKVVLYSGGKTYSFGPISSSNETDLVALIPLDGLKPNTSYTYSVEVNGRQIQLPSNASISTLPGNDRIRIAFGTCPHRWGLGNQQQADMIMKRKPSAFLMYGDVGAQDKRNHFGKHRSDYQIRDFFPAWRSLSASIPTYVTWDDHDYFDNDLAGVPRGFTDFDRDSVRQVFSQAWNNPSYGFNNNGGGIFFRTRFGPCDVLMLDNRYFRTGEKRGFLGNDQTNWLKEQLLDCKGPFIIITCGTMWTDHISNGKDSWGKFDPEGREEIFQFIEENNISGVVLLSGDRHGACGFKIPRPSGYTFYEFEAATLGGRTGPAIKAKENPNALYAFQNKYAFGEFTVDASLDDPQIHYRLIHESGEELYQIKLHLSELTPGGNS